MNRICKQSAKKTHSKRAKIMLSALSPVNLNWKFRENRCLNFSQNDTLTFFEPNGRSMKRCSIEFYTTLAKWILLTYFHEIESHISKTKENVLISIKTVRKRFSSVTHTKSKRFFIPHIFGWFEIRIDITFYHFSSSEMFGFGQCFECFSKSNESNTFSSKMKKRFSFCVLAFNWNFRRKW